MKHSKTIIIIGWLGTFGIFGAYGLNILGAIASTSLIYILGNLLGALLLGIRVYADRNWANLTMEVFFAIIAIIALVKYFIS